MHDKNNYKFKYYINLHNNPTHLNLISVIFFADGVKSIVPKTKRSSTAKAEHAMAWLGRFADMYGDKIPNDAKVI